MGILKSVLKENKWARVGVGAGAVIVAGILVFAGWVVYNRDNLGQDAAQREERERQQLKIIESKERSSDGGEQDEGEEGEVDQALDETVIAVGETDARIVVPDRWVAEKDEDHPNSILLWPPVLRETCSIRVTHGENETYSSATAFLNFFDLGKRRSEGSIQLDPDAEKEQRIIDVAGLEAAFFSWRDENQIRYQEAYIVHGAYVTALFYREDLNFIDRQPVPCFRDFEQILTTGFHRD